MTHEFNLLVGCNTYLGLMMAWKIMDKRNSSNGKVSTLLAKTGNCLFTADGLKILSKYTFLLKRQ